MLPPWARSRFPSHPTGSDHQNRQIWRDVIDLAYHRAVSWRSIQGLRWMLDGHDSHVSALIALPSKFHSAKPHSVASILLKRQEGGAGLSAACTP
jgi:hypothetical protein